jgi:hypothetical protein
MSLGSCGCQFVPPYLLRQLADSRELGTPVTEEAARAAGQTLATDAAFRRARAEAAAQPTTHAAGPIPWTVHTAGNGTALPGALVRSAGDPDSGDAAVDEAAYGGQGALDLFREVYGRDSFDGAGAAVTMTVHYGRSYDNAFWNGAQLVFGDGDGRIFDRFTKPVDVLGHELTHAVTEHTAGLVYQDQPGALNESLSDVFASCLKQRLLGQTTDQADWLIGQGLFLPGIHARALRDMAAPGTAYDDPQLGSDPQVGHLRDYVDTTDDNGGVHLNSGIPNKAFHLAATAIGGTSWEGAGRIWYAALTGPDVGPDTDFAGFAAATVAAAGDHAEAVARAWVDVGVTPSGATAPSVEPGPAPAEVVSVRRSGGFAGLTTSGSVALMSDDPRASQVRDLVARVDLAEVAAGPAHPDMYVYSFSLPGSPVVDVPEHELSDDLRSLARLVLGD